MDYICKTCKWFKVRMVDNAEKYFCGESEEEEPTDPNAPCGGWTDPEEIELTDEEKADIVGDIEAHRRMVEGREIE